MHSGARLASTPQPPYVAVIFTSVRRPDDEAGYAAASAELDALVTRQPGFLGLESARDAALFGITVSYWRDAAAARAWKAVATHRGIQQLGRERWYECYRVRIATVEREYGYRATQD